PGFKDFIAQFFASSLQEAKREIETLVDNDSRSYLLVAQKYQQGQAAVCVSVDITELKRTEEALRLSEEKFAKAFRCCPNSITISTLADGRYIEVNETFVRYSGYQRQEAIGYTAQELNIWVHPTDRDRMVDHLQQYGAIINQEYEFRTKSGEILIGLLSAEIIRLKGQPCLLALTHDITQRKQAEQRLRESEIQYRAIFEATTDGLIISDLDGQLVEVNPAACQMHGYSYSEFIQLDPKRFIHPDSHPVFYEYLAAVRRGVPFQREAVDLRSDGTPFPIEVRGTGFMYKGKPHLLAVVRDITEQKQAEARLREAAERDRLLGEIAARIRQSLDLNEIMNTTVEEVRHFLQADRVLISYMDAAMHGKVVAESVADSFPSCWDLAVENDDYLQELIALFEHTDVQVIDDTRLIETSPERADYLHRFQVKAALAVAIVVDEQMYGLLVAHQCTNPRHWQPMEVDLLRRLATQVAIAINQGRLYQQLGQLNLNLEHQVQERTAQLQQKMQELQELNQLKDVFLHAVSHDLRTPVMGMLMVLKNILNSYASDETQD
ncbi:MAG: PAS domain S-box protein, partial [Coleofasciculus sp. C2-GNP5-27]